MAQVSNRGALTSTNFRVTGSNQATRRNAKINPHKIAQTVPSECARKSQIVCSFAIALERDNTNIVAYTPLEKSTRTRDAVIKWFVQSATHQNNLDLKLAFREHGNVLSPSPFAFKRIQRQTANVLSCRHAFSYPQSTQPTDRMDAKNRHCRKQLEYCRPLREYNLDIDRRPIPRTRKSIPPPPLPLTLLRPISYDKKNSLTTAPGPGDEPGANGQGPKTKGQWPRSQPMNRSQGVTIQGHVQWPGSHTGAMALGKGQDRGPGSGPRPGRGPGGQDRLR
jgi:hypothetical protein